MNDHIKKVKCENCGEWVDEDELDEDRLCDVCGHRKAVAG